MNPNPRSRTNRFIVPLAIVDRPPRIVRRHDPKDQENQVLFHEKTLSDKSAEAGNAGAAG